MTPFTEISNLTRIETMKIAEKIISGIENLMHPKKWSRAGELEYLRKVYEPCPLCGSGIDGHKVAILGACNIQDDDTELLHFRELIRQRRWPDVMVYKNSSQSVDYYSFEALKCINEVIIVLTVISYADLWSDDKIKEYEILNEIDSKQLDNLLVGKWEYSF